jgi:hypothetical protein
VVKPNTGMPKDQEPEDHEEQSSSSQVSEVSGMAAAGAGQPIMPDQSVAGAPDADSGETQAGGVGPNARPRHNAADQEQPEQEPDRKR